jgi:rhodanese-related sulfurtransferase
MPKRVTPKEAAELMSQGWTYVDVRSIPEFEQGHPRGAVNVPLLHAHGGRMVPNARFAEIVEAAFARDDRLVVGCKMGGRSLQAATMLEAAGFKNVVDMRGGFSGERDMFGRVQTPGWSESGLPVATEAEPGKSYAEIEKKAAP